MNLPKSPLLQNGYHTIYYNGNAGRTQLEVLPHKRDSWRQHLTASLLMEKKNMDGFSNLKHAPFAEQVQEQIYQFILNTPLPVGARLPNEFELGRKFGVGRSTVRGRR